MSYSDTQLIIRLLAQLELLGTGNAEDWEEEQETSLVHTGDGDGVGVGLVYVV